MPEKKILNIKEPVELNFNKIFYKPEKLREVTVILKELEQVEKELKKLEEGLVL